MEATKLRNIENETSHTYDSNPPANASNENTSSLYYFGQLPSLAVPIIGYIQPVCVVVTVVFNVLVCIILIKKKMRTPTNMILLSMAVADTLTGVFPLPVALYLFTFGNYQEWIPHQYCYVVHFFYEILPTIFHTVSIWLTVGLALQRYIYICKAMDAKRICSINRVSFCIGAIFVMGILIHMSRLFDSEFLPIDVQSRIDPENTFKGCEEKVREWADDNYFTAYFLIRVGAIHIIPCVSLVILNALLVYAMRVAQARRRCLLLQNRKSEWKRIQDSNCTTLMLVAVVTVFLLVEIPLGITITLLVVQNVGHVYVFDDNAKMTIFTIINLFILLSYPLNFVIYCTMSRQFRKSFCSLFFRNSMDSENDQTNYLSVAQESNGNFKNGNSITTTCVL